MSDRGGATPSHSERRATSLRTALAISGLVVLALLVWRLADVILLGFASVLFAIVLRSLAGTIEHHTPLRPPWSLIASGLLIATAVAAFVFLLGAEIKTQASELVDRFPELISSLGDRLGIENLRERLTNRLKDFAGRSGLLGTIAGYTSVAVAIVANALLVLVAGIYLAMHPHLYRRGLLQLVPKRRRDQVGSTLDNAGNALRLWLVGQLISMTLVGVLTTVGLYLIGMPSVVALGFLAGVAEFVPLVGPALSAIPAIFVAVSEGGSMVLWVIGLYLVVQQIEGNVIMPLVQQRTVDLPPVVAMFALLSLGVLFGPLGVLLGTPITVVLYVAVKQLYVREALGEETEIPGEDEGRDRAPHRP